MQAKKSRPQQWAEACEAARAALGAIEGLIGDLDSALSELRDLRDEYEEWQGNLPDNLSSSALGEKLDEIVNLNLDVEIDLGEVETAIEEAEGVELPRGFGRD